MPVAAKIRNAVDDDVCLCKFLLQRLLRDPGALRSSAFHFSVYLRYLSDGRSLKTNSWQFLPSQLVGIFYIWRRRNWSSSDFPFYYTYAVKFDPQYRRCRGFDRKGNLRRWFTIYAPPFCLPNKNREKNAREFLLGSTDRRGLALSV